MSTPDVIKKCFLCNTSFPFSNHRYEGKHSNGVMVCMPCWNAAHDGFAPHHAEKIRNYLKQQGKSVPSVDEEGRLPR